MDKDRLREAITELTTNSFRLGVVTGGGSEYFLQGKVYSLADLQAEQERLAKQLAAVIDEELGD